MMVVDVVPPANDLTPTGAFHHWRGRPSHDKDVVTFRAPTFVNPTPIEGVLVHNGTTWWICRQPQLTAAEAVRLDLEDLRRTVGWRASRIKAAELDLRKERKNLKLAEAELAAMEQFYVSCGGVL